MNPLRLFGALRAGATIGPDTASPDDPPGSMLDADARWHGAATPAAPREPTPGAEALEATHAQKAERRVEFEQRAADDATVERTAQMQATEVAARVETERVAYLDRLAGTHGVDGVEPPSRAALAAAEVAVTQCDEVLAALKLRRERHDVELRAAQREEVEARRDLVWAWVTAKQREVTAFDAKRAALETEERRAYAELHELHDARDQAERELERLSRAAGETNRA